MKKETGIAVGLGIFLGIAVGLVVLLNTSQPQGTSDIEQPQVDLVQNAQKANNVITFEVSEPENGITVNSDSITIKGKATKESLLIFQSPLGNEVVQTEGDTFSVDFPLAFGENVINVTFYPKGSPNDYQEKILRVYYLEE